MSFPLWLIFPAIIALYYLVKVTREEEDLSEGFVAGFGMGLLAVIVEAVIGVLVSVVIPEESTPMHQKRVETQQLADLSTADTLHGAGGGNIFLSSWYIDSQEVYRYFYADGPGYRRGNLNASEDVMIFEEDRTDGVLKTVKTFDGETECRDNPRYAWLRHAVIWNRPACSELSETDRYEFHIPKGSIQRSYQMR